MLRLCLDRHGEDGWEDAGTQEADGTNQSQRHRCRHGCPCQHGDDGDAGQDVRPVIGNVADAHHDKHADERTCCTADEIHLLRDAGLGIAPSEPLNQYLRTDKVCVYVDYHDEENAEGQYQYDGILQKGKRGGHCHIGLCNRLPFNGCWRIL